MQNIVAIWQREMKAYFVSPIAYVVLTVFTFISGWIFIGRLMYEIQSSIQRSMMLAQYGQGSLPINIPANVMVGYLSTITFIMLLILPMLTMGLFAEEKKRGTIELLLTTPVTNFQAITGKYLASLTFLLIIFSSSAITISPLFIYGQPDWKPILAGYLGMVLYGIALLALGLFISTLTENQIVAVIITFGATLLLWIINYISSSMTGVTKDILDYISVINHVEDFIRGIIDTSHIIFYVTFAFVGLFLAYRSLESMRWKS